ncbi:MAG: hypothetical protein R2939_08530 [Kofleriaceae bacterium]
MTDTVPPGLRLTCPACGVPVTPGYVKCPKCHAKLPPPPRIKRSTAAPGGTVVEANQPPWLLLGAGVVLAGSVIGYLMLRDDTPPKKTAPVPAAVRPTTAVPPVVAPDDPDPPSLTPDPEVERAEAQAAALATFRRELQLERLFATVTVEDDRLEIRSSSCPDPAMRAKVEAHAAALRVGGLTLVRCRLEHSEIVFEHAL